MDVEVRLAMRWAALAGEQALPLFLVLLVLACGGASAVWWVLQTRHVQPRVAHLAPGAVLGLWLGGGFVVIVACAALFAELAEGLDADEALGHADQAFTDALGRSVPLAAVRVFALLTHLGDPLTLTLLGLAVAGALLWQRRRLLALTFSLTLIGNGVLNPTLKAVFERVRPHHAGGLVQADGFSFPSGHSSGSLVAFGMLAYVAMRTLPTRWHLPALLAAVALAFTVGCSRVFLRVHFASDVAAGFASGAAWLAVCIAGAEVTRWLWQRPRRSAAPSISP